MDNPWNGGGGYSTEEVCQMTLDGIWARLCDLKILRDSSSERTEKMEGLNAISSVGNEDGSLKGRSRTGEPLKLVTRGISKAQAIREGVYEGWVINANTGERQYLTPKNKET